MSEPENKKWVLVRRRRVPREQPPPDPVTDQMCRDHEAMEWLERGVTDHEGPPSLVSCADGGFKCGRWNGRFYMWGTGHTLTDAILDAKAKWEAER